MAHRETVRRGYDEFAERYAERNSTDERRVAVLESFLGSRSGPKRLLDVGCGHGTPALREVAPDSPAVGLDLSREQLRIARETDFAGALVQADAAALPFRADAFDAVTAFDSLIHVPLSDHRTVVEEFARVLRPGGGVLLSEAPEAVERTTQDWLDGGGEMRWTMAGVEATRNRLRDAGFTVTKQWDAPERAADDGPQPPFLAARLDTGSP